MSRENAEYCRLSDLAVTQISLPPKMEGYKEYKVMVENRCICTQTNVKLACGGFNASMGVDPDVLSMDDNGNLCSLNSGGRISMAAWALTTTSSSPTRFDPESSTMACS